MAADPTHEADAVETVRQWVNSARYDEELIELEAQTLRAMLATHDATVAELERLRAEQALLARRLRHAYRSGFDDRHYSALAALGLASSNRESLAQQHATKVLAEIAEADAAPQQPAQPCPSTTVSDETKGDQ